MDSGEALRRLTELPGISRPRAEKELLRLSRFPSDAVAAVVGWLLITALRTSQARNNPAFDLQSFHRQVLEQGPVPPPLLIKQGFGEQQWRDLCAEVGFEETRLRAGSGEGAAAAD
jgi:hypothetical protein